MKLRTLYISFFMLLGVLYTNAQNANFKRTYGGNAYAAGNSLVKTPDGGYLCVGSSSATATGTTDVYIFKTDSNGVHQWAKYYGGGVIDVANHIVATPDNEYVVCGYTNSFGGGGYQVYLLKINNVGDTLWTKTFGGADWDFGNEVYVSQSGSIYIAAQTFSYGNSANGMLIKTDANGNELYTKVFGGVGEENFSALCGGPDNTVVVAGHTDSYGQGNKDAYVIVTDTNGIKVDSLIYGGSQDDILNDISAIGTGFIGGGESRSTDVNTPNVDIFVLRIDSIFDHVWNATFDDGGANAVVAAANQSGYSVAGYGQNLQTTAPPTAFVWIGTPQPGAWLPNYCPFLFGNPKREMINDIIKVPGGWCAIGSSEIYAPGFSSAILMRLNDDLSNCLSPAVVVNTLEDKMEGVNLYPNPGTGMVRISMPEYAKSLSMVVYNALGQQVFYKNYSGVQQVEEDFSGFGNGLYNARITADGKYTVKTFVIAR